MAQNPNATLIQLRHACRLLTYRLEVDRPKDADAEPFCTITDADGSTVALGDLTTVLEDFYAHWASIVASVSAQIGSVS